MRPLLAPLVLALAFVAPAGAEHCTTWTTDPDVEVDTNPGEIPVVPRYYVDRDEPALPCCVLGVWVVYEESNGIDGLQREDEISDATCHGMIEPDTILL